MLAITINDLTTQMSPDVTDRSEPASRRATSLSFRSVKRGGGDGGGIGGSASDPRMICRSNLAVIIYLGGPGARLEPAEQSSVRGGGGGSRGMARGMTASGRDTGGPMIDFNFRPLEEINCARRLAGYAGR